MNAHTERLIDHRRREASAKLDPRRRSMLGQFMTPTAIADFMASLFSPLPVNVRLLDPGAGVGSLTDAFAERYFRECETGGTLTVVAYEIDPILVGYLQDHLAGLQKRARDNNLGFTIEVIDRDFIEEATFQLGFSQEGRFTHAILNPPYKKISTGSKHRKMLSHVGIETVNLYAAFLALAVALVESGGEIVAIVPRSFCNGTYFRSFRKWLLARVAIRRIHIFESRKKAFHEDDVLQENVIVLLERDRANGDVVVSMSEGSTFDDLVTKKVPFSQIVRSDDPDAFIHVPIAHTEERPDLFQCTLEELGVSVSTGPVVDFRVREYWLQKPHSSAAPLLYPHHFKTGVLTFPNGQKKPNALRVTAETERWLMPAGCYTLVKRFSSKEERRRLVAYVVDEAKLPYRKFGIENHLNVFHVHRHGLVPELAHGLAMFLNSTAADQHFRSFSGHTQVNANDLRSMKYPTRARLEALGDWAMRQSDLSQDAIDGYLAREASGEAAD